MNKVYNFGIPFKPVFSTLKLWAIGPYKFAGLNCPKKSSIGRHYDRFIEKMDNPTNLPQCSPIEDFFGQLSSIVYKDGWTAKNVEELKNG